MLELLKLYILI